MYIHIHVHAHHMYFLLHLVSSEHSTYVSITTLPSPTLTQHTYRVVCHKLGEQKLTFLIGNGPTSNNPMPANETTSIKYVNISFTCTLYNAIICISNYN